MFDGWLPSLGVCRCLWCADEGGDDRRLRDRLSGEMYRWRLFTAGEVTGLLWSVVARAAGEVALAGCVVMDEGNNCVRGAVCALCTVARDVLVVQAAFTTHLVVTGGCQDSAGGGRDGHCVTRPACKGAVL